MEFKRTAAGEYMLGDYLKVVFSRVTTRLYAKAFLPQLSEDTALINFSNPIKNMATVLKGIKALDDKYNLKAITLDDFHAYKNGDQDAANMMRNLWSDIVQLRGAVTKK